jgi:hypothetical protein
VGQAIRCALQNVVASVMKRDCAPASSMAHANAAIACLAAADPEWDPGLSAARKVLADAKQAHGEHGA